MIDPFSHNSILYRPTDKDDTSDPSFFDTVAANLGYQYQPVLDFIDQRIKHGVAVDKNYNPMEDMEGYDEHSAHLISAQNAEHMAEMKLALDENLKRRKVMADAGFMYNLGASVFDPVNLVALPFGGAGVGVARAFMRGGASVATLQAGLEASRAPFDPLATKEEVAINMATSFFVGGVLSSAVSIPRSTRAKVLEPTMKASNEAGITHSATPLIEASRRKLEVTTERPLIQISDPEIASGIQVNEIQAKLFSDKLQRTQQDVGAAQKFFDSATTPENIKIGKENLDELKAILKEDKRILKEAETNLTAFKAEQTARVATEAEIAKTKDAHSLKSNLFTDSPLYKFVTTPMKRVLQDKQVPDSVKKVLVQIAGDSGLSLNLHTKGYSAGASTYQKAAIRDGEWVVIYDKARQLFQDEYGRGKTFLDYNVGDTVQRAAEVTRLQTKQKTFEQWMQDVNIKRIKGEQPSSKPEGELMAEMDRFYKQWEDRLNQTGLLENQSFLTKEGLRLNREIKVVREKIQNTTGKRNDIARAKLEKLETELDRVEFKQQLLGDELAGAVEPFNPRYWNKKVVESRRADLERILADWFRDNPRVYLFDESAAFGSYRKLKSELKTLNKKYNDPKTSPNQKASLRKKIDTAQDELSLLTKQIEAGGEKVTLSGSQQAIALRAKEAVDEILQIADATDPNVAYYGSGRPRHTKHRALDIPNSLVTDFIETNPMSVMKAYTAKVSPLYEFKNTFGKNSEEVFEDVEDALYEAGLSEQKVNAVLKDMMHLEDRVRGSVIRNMDAMNMKIANGLKDAAMLNYLGSAGFATIPDFAKVVMEHELGATFKTLFAVMSDNRVKLNAREGRIAGEILDIIKGDSHLRLVEQMKNNPLNEGLMSKVRGTFFMLNGVAPMTTIFKRLDSMVRSHTLIDYSVKLTEGKAKPFEVEYLARYNIDQARAKMIASMPYEKTETGLYLANTEKWTNQNATESFRQALNSGIGNTVLMGTPADKPIAVDGVFYVPMHIAGKFGMKQDAKYKGYARIENGLLGLPFQFMSYSFAAMNKITASIAQNQVKNRAVGIAASVGLGYMSMELRYKDWQMEQMNFSDKLARSVDASGLFALMSDLMYTSMATSAALGGPDIGAGILQPKFPQEPNVVDGLTGFAGAGPSWAVDTARALREFVEGNYTEGAVDLVKQGPYAKVWLWKDLVNETGRAFTGGRY